MTKTLLFSLLVLFASIDLRAQVLPYAKEVVKSLSSEDFHGRGYVHDGDKIAADFIRNEFRRFGLKSFTNDYYQTFSIPINTFPGAIELIVDGDTLSPGVDFLVNYWSPSIQGEFHAFHASNFDLSSLGSLRGVLRDSRGKVLVLNQDDEERKREISEESESLIKEAKDFLRFHPQNSVSATLFIENELSGWNNSTRQLGKPSIVVVDSILKKMIERVEFNIEAEFIENYTTQNVIGYLDGENNDSTIVIIAHYDHFGRMGTALFPGANDNASGTAMMLSLARHFSENTPKYRTVFIAFGAEEIGLIGSKYFVQNPLFDLTSIKFLMNFDLAGTGDEGIQVVNGSVYRKQFDRLRNINNEFELLPQVKIRGAACNSDHCAFDEVNVPGFYIYTLGGIRAYHDVFDRYETLPFTEFEDYHQLMVRFLEGM